MPSKAHIEKRRVFITKSIQVRKISKVKKMYRIIVQVKEIKVIKPKLEDK